VALRREIEVNEDQTDKAAASRFCSFEVSSWNLTAQPDSVFVHTDVPLDHRG
jgi:hypothetical protein